MGDVADYENIGQMARRVSAGWGVCFGQGFAALEGERDTSWGLRKGTGKESPFMCPDQELVCPSR